jgi:hypothetical protein
MGADHRFRRTKRSVLETHTNRFALATKFCAGSAFRIGTFLLVWVSEESPPSISVAIWEKSFERLLAAAR